MRNRYFYVQGRLSVFGFDFVDKKFKLFSSNKWGWRLGASWDFTSEETLLKGFHNPAVLGSFDTLDNPVEVLYG